MNNNPRDALMAVAHDVARWAREATGDDALLCAFISGSVSRRDVACYQRDIYSDVDIYIVVTDDVDATALKGVLRERVSGYTDVGGWTLRAAPDVGVYKTNDLRNQAARPGTVDIVDFHDVVYGDAQLPAALPQRASDIAADEALYLLENRLNEIHIGDEKPTQDRFYLYQAAKCGRDIASAALIQKQRYITPPAERRARFEGEEMRPWLDEAMRRGVVLSMDSLNDIQAALNDPATLQTLHDDMPGLLARAWMGIARDLSSQKHGDLVRLVRWRCAPAQALSGVRQARVMAKRRGLGAATLLKTGPVAVRFGPMCLLRLSGLLAACDNMALDPSLAELRDAHGTLVRAFDRNAAATYDAGKALWGWFA